MSGIERLRDLAHDYVEQSWSAAGKVRGRLLFDIADQIERELREERDRWDEELCEAQMDKTRVMDVYLEMNKHVSGVEGMADSPVARWARELRYALKSDTSDERDAQNPSCHDASDAADVTSEAPKVTRDPAEDVSMSAYDLLPEDEREAIAWVREQGGLDEVREEWKRRCNLKRMCEKEKAKVERQQRHIEFVQGKCRERQTRIVELNKTIADMRPRLMPEGCEWPRYESGEPVRIGDEYVCWCGETHRLNSVTIKKYNSIINVTEPHTFVVSDGPFTSHGKLVKRPAVLAADGEPLEVGQTVWHIESGNEYTVKSVAQGIVETSGGQYVQRELTHRAPVLAADGRPLREGETVWDTKGNGPYSIQKIENDGVIRINGNGLDYFGSDFVHERPDSWERLEEDAGCTATKYNERRGTIFTTKQQVARDLVRRAKKLAERERGER